MMAAIFSGSSGSFGLRRFAVAFVLGNPDLLHAVAVGEALAFALTQSNGGALAIGDVAVFRSGKDR